MPSPLSNDLRARFLAAYQAEEGSLRELAVRFRVGEATTNRWWSRFKRTGEVDPRKPGGGHEPMLDETDLESIDLLTHDFPTLTVTELIAKFVEEGGRPVSRSTMQRALTKLGYTRKKTLRGPTLVKRLG